LEDRGDVVLGRIVAVDDERRGTLGHLVLQVDFHNIEGLIDCLRAAYLNTRMNMHAVVRRTLARVVDAGQRSPDGDATGICFRVESQNLWFTADGHDVLNVVALQRQVQSIGLILSRHARLSSISYEACSRCLSTVRDRCADTLPISDRPSRTAEC